MVGGSCFCTDIILLRTGTRVSVLDVKNAPHGFYGITTFLGANETTTALCGIIDIMLKDQNENLVVDWVINTDSRNSRDKCTINRLPRA
jgi:hypothetical protein